MAEIHVQTKKRAMPLWIWLVLILLILGVIAYVVVIRNNKTDQIDKTNKSSPTSLIRLNDPNDLLWV